MPNDAPWDAYANTVLLIGSGHSIKVDLRAPVSDAQRQLLTNLGLGSTFAIVTPYDPRGERAPAWRNLVRYIGTRAHLRRDKVSFVPAIGQSPDATHRERGFAIAISRGEAASLARELGQLALYWFDGEAFWIDGVLSPREPLRLPISRS